jgi:hypothetical protein
MLGAVWPRVRGDVVKLLLVPVIEATFVLDVKLVTWEKLAENPTPDRLAESSFFAALWPNASPAARLDSDRQVSAPASSGFFLSLARNLLH